MPSTIPYDPSLALGAIVNPSAIETLTQISGLSAEIDAAQENLNSFISMKRSIDRTIVELIDMEVDPLEIKAKSEEIKKAISKAAMEYAALRLENEAKIRPLKAKVQSVHQALDSPIDFTVGTGFPAERAAYAAWRSGHVVDSDAYAALEEICRFLVQDARLVEARQVQNVHLNPAAWEIQQAAYLVRLGFSAGYLSRAGAQAALKRLQEAARAHYASWEDFSLSGLTALGVRSPIDSFDLGNWRKIARSHEVLLRAQRTTLAHAARWKVFTAAPAPSSRWLEPGPQLAEA